MVHDKKVTVPLQMKTPPPCKHKRKTCENPIGAMWEKCFSLCGTHNLKLTKASAAVLQARIEASASAFFHRGDGNFRCLCGTLPL